MQLVLEFHYEDGDVGAYRVTELTDAEQSAARLLWNGFSTIDHKAKQIVLRRATEEETTP